VITHTRTHATEPDSGTSSDGAYAGYALEQLVTNQTEMPVFSNFRSRLASQVTIKKLSRPPPPTNDTPWGGTPTLYRGDGHAILFRNLENQMVIQERVDALKSEVDQLTERLQEKSKLAASEDIEGRGDPIKAAREMLELKEILKLKKLALNQACHLQLEMAEIERDAERRAAREEIQAHILQIESFARKMRATVKRLGNQYKELVGIEEKIFHLGKHAHDWPYDGFKHLRFGELTYDFLVNALAAEMTLEHRHFDHWPNQIKASEKAEPGVAFSSYIRERIQYDDRL